MRAGGIDVKKHVLCFLLKFKSMFFGFLLFKFLCSLNVVFLLFLKQKRKRTELQMHFSWAKTPFPGQSECFVAVLLTLFDSY